MTVHEALPSNIRQFSPQTPKYNEAADEIGSEHIFPNIPIGDEERFLKPKGRGRKSEYLKRPTFKTFQTVSIPSQNNRYQNISSGICRIPTLQAMAIVGLRSGLNDNHTPIIADHLSNRPKKSSTFSCDPMAADPTNKSNSLSNEGIFSSLLVTSSSPNLSHQTFSTKCTTLANVTSSPSMDRDYKSNLILNPVFENHPRPVNLSIPVEIVTTSSKG